MREFWSCALQRLIRRIHRDLDLTFTKMESLKMTGWGSRLSRNGKTLVFASSVCF